MQRAPLLSVREGGAWLSTPEQHCDARKGLQGRRTRSSVTGFCAQQDTIQDRCICSLGPAPCHDQLDITCAQLACDRNAHASTDTCHSLLYLSNLHIDLSGRQLIHSDCRRRRWACVRFTADHRASVSATLYTKLTCSHQNLGKHSQRPSQASHAALEDHPVCAVQVGTRIAA